MQTYLWSMFVAAFSTAAAWVARRSATAVWSKVSHTDAPPNPADREVSWASALAWAGLAGLTAGLARVLGQRGASAAWTKVTKSSPPGIAA